MMLMKNNNNNFNVDNDEKSGRLTCFRLHAITIPFPMKVICQFGSSIIANQLSNAALPHFFFADYYYDVLILRGFNALLWLPFSKMLLP